MDVILRSASEKDAEFLSHVFFTTQRWIIERLFGWRGDEFEYQRLRKNHSFRDAKIIVVNGEDAGWLIVKEPGNCIEIDGIYILPEFQRRGVGTRLISDIIDRADLQRLPVRLSVAKINPARQLYGALHFNVVDQSEFKVVMERPHRGSA